MLFYMWKEIAKMKCRGEKLELEVIINLKSLAKAFQEIHLELNEITASVCNQKLARFFIHQLSTMVLQG